MKFILAIALSLATTFCFAQSDKEIKGQVSKIPRGTKTIILTLDSTKSQKDLLADLVASQRLTGKS